MHRLVLDAPSSLNVDHINGNGLDNRRKNLRLANEVQSAANRRKTTKKTSSRYKGVSGREGRWLAYITVNDKRRYLGIFVDEHEAALAYNVAALGAFAEFAFLNEVEKQ